MGIVFTVTTIAPIVAIVQDTIKIHPGTIDAYLSGKNSGFTFINYYDLFTSKMAKTNLWIPLLNTIVLATGACVVSILYGGIFAFSTISQLDFYFSLHYATVDFSRCMAKSV